MDGGSKTWAEQLLAIKMDTARIQRSSTYNGTLAIQILLNLQALEKL
jgi:hypothetical protein